MTNTNYWLESINTAKYKAVNLVANAIGRTDLLYYPENPTTFDAVVLPTEQGDRFRLDMEEYCDILRTNMQNFFLDEGTLDQLREIARYCDENGIELIFVFPPMHECVFDLVTGPLNIDESIAYYKDSLKEVATVYDFEFKNDFTCNSDNFKDGFHLVGESRKEFINVLFSDSDSPMVIRYGR